MEGKVQAAAIPWFARDDYESFRAVLPDREWHPTYEEWEWAAKKTLDKLQKRGLRTVKAHVRSDAFVGWCRATGRNIDNQALLDFANDVAYRAHTGEQRH